LIVPMTMRKTITRGEEFVRQYKKDEAIATRDSMAKCLYASLFDWIVLQVKKITYILLFEISQDFFFFLLFL